MERTPTALSLDNGLRYEYATNNSKHLILNVVVCHETWQELDKNAQDVTSESKHAWLSSRPLHADDVHERCNLGGRHRWGIEAGFLVEKHQGYYQPMLGKKKVIEIFREVHVSTLLVGQEICIFVFFRC